MVFKAMKTHPSIVFTLYGVKTLEVGVFLLIADKMKENEALRFLNTLDDLKIYKEGNWINEVHQRMLLDNNEIHFNEISRDD